MHTTPIVAAVPNAVPMRNDMAPVSRKTASGAMAGVTNGVASSTTSEMVPAARHSAVRMPMSMNDSRTPRAPEMPSSAIPSTSRTEWPRAMP